MLLAPTFESLFAGTDGLGAFGAGMLARCLAGEDRGFGALLARQLGEAAP